MSLVFRLPLLIGVGSIILGFGRVKAFGSVPFPRVKIIGSAGNERSIKHWVSSSSNEKDVRLESRLAEENACKLRTALYSPSGKLTLSPELVVPEPNDESDSVFTSILLHVDAVRTLSSRVRAGKSNVAFINVIPNRKLSEQDGKDDKDDKDINPEERAEAEANSIATVLQTFSSEQQQGGQGKFPGPVPIVLYGTSNFLWTEDAASAWVKITESGANGVLLPVLVQKISSSTTVIYTYDRDSWKEKSALVKRAGLLPIPELIFQNQPQQPQQPQQNVSHQDMELLINSVIQDMGEVPNDKMMACIVCTLLPIPTDTPSRDEENAEDNDDDTFPIMTMIQPNDDDNRSKVPLYTNTNTELLPSIPKSKFRNIFIIGSIRTPANDVEDILSKEVATLKRLGYAGAFLRKECLPNYDRFYQQMVVQQHQQQGVRSQNQRKAGSGGIPSFLDLTSQFWEACISDLKSTRSKNFGGFRAKNNMDMTTADKWIRYRKSVLDSGALGDNSGSHESIGGGSGESGFNPSAGDYKGFG